MCGCGCGCVCGCVCVCVCERERVRERERMRRRRVKSLEEIREKRERRRMVKKSNSHKQAKQGIRQVYSSSLIRMYCRPCPRLQAHPKQNKSITNSKQMVSTKGELAWARLYEISERERECVCVCVRVCVRKGENVTPRALSPCPQTLK